MSTGEEIDTLRIQAHVDIEAFVKNFVRKYRQLFVGNAWRYKIFPSSEMNFPYEVKLAIKIKEQTS